MSLGISYESLCDTMHISPLQNKVRLNKFSSNEAMNQSTRSERLTAALHVFVDLFVQNEVGHDSLDAMLIDKYIVQIDQNIARYLDNILHHPNFQAMESLWRSVAFLLEKSDSALNVKVELLDISQQALLEDFKNAPSVERSGLFYHVYTQEYDMPGGEPFAAMVSDFGFDVGQQDIALLEKIAKVSAAAHCPFLGNVTPQFFGKTSFDDVTEMTDLSTYMERAETIAWRNFRSLSDSRYVGLTLPRFLLRLPYGPQNLTKGFHYVEDVKENADHYLWGGASFALASNMIESFKGYGWAVNIRGPESGGKVSPLPIPQFDFGHGVFTKIPTQFLIPETRELELANLGLIPLSYYKNSQSGCFFSANSAHKPNVYLENEATANARINARLPYIFLMTRLGHYLKVIQRENVGSTKNPQVLANELNAWLATLITKMNNPSPELIAQHPLREGEVTVSESPDNPGFYRVHLYAVPHFQIEGVDVKLSLVGHMPKKIAAH